MTPDIDLITMLAAESIASDPNMLVPWYLMASYLYYLRNSSIFTDAFYDQIRIRLGKELDEVNLDHRHAHLCIRGGGVSGVFMLTEDDYPGITKDTAIKLATGQLP